MKKTILTGGLSLIAALLLIQLVPYRVSNPAPTREPTWDAPQTRALAVRACYDCHSDEVHTPWYGKIAPVSWWITNHVNNGRAALNFSDWHGPTGEGAQDAAETVRDGSMPPSYYTWFGLHSRAKLTATERQELASGLLASLSH